MKNLWLVVLALCLGGAAWAGRGGQDDDGRFRDACSSLEGNPARGAAPGGWHVLKPDGNAAGSPKGFCSWLWDIGQFSGGNEYKGKRPDPARIGTADIPLTADALACVSNTLANARANGAVMVVRFGYTWSDQCGCEPGDFETLLAHVGQLGPVLAAFPDVVLAVECGMCGPWAEMHSSNYLTPDHKRRLMDAWLDTLAKSTALLVRSPSCVVEYARKDSAAFLGDVRSGAYYRTQPAMRRIGLYNDGYLGTAWDYGTWPGGANSFTREQGVEYLEARRNVPYGGELAYIGDAEAEKVPLFDPKQYNLVREWYRTHLSYLRNINGQSESLPRRIGRLTFTHDYDFEGMPDLSEWYGRDLRTFMREHMGYRFVLRGAKVTRTAVEATIENTGFGHLLLRSRAEVLADGRMQRQPLDLRPLKPGERRTFTLRLPKGVAAGKSTRVALRLVADTPAAQPIRFANDTLWDAALGAFRLAGPAD